MDCIIYAGGQIRPKDPLYIYTQGKQKALLDIHGKPMIEYVIEALKGSSYVDGLVIVGLDTPLEKDYGLPTAYLPDRGSLVSNILAGINWLKEHRPAETHALACSADIPTLTSDIVNDYVAACQPLESSLYYPFVTQETMEQRFPGSNRTFVKLQGLRAAGGDLIMGRSDLADGNEELVEALTEGRKHAWRLARTIGLAVLLKFLFRRLSLQDIEDLGPRVIGHPITTVLCPYAEVAMDADKPHQVELLRADLTLPGQVK